jgi:hypothetical protein
MSLLFITRRMIQTLINVYKQETRLSLYHSSGNKQQTHLILYHSFGFKQENHLSQYHSSDYKQDIYQGLYHSSGSLVYNQKNDTD